MTDRVVRVAVSSQPRSGPSELDLLVNPLICPACMAAILATQAANGPRT
jgi:hypothetical protein